MTKKLFALTFILTVLTLTAVACTPMTNQANAAPEVEPETDTLNENDLQPLPQAQQIIAPQINTQIVDEVESAISDEDVYLPIVTNEPTETVPEDVEDYNLYTALNSTTTYLIDSEGNAIHTWESSYRPGNAVYLLENGSLLRTGTINSQDFDTGGAGGVVQILDADSNVTWEFTYNSSEYRLHHDIEMMPNGNIIMIAWELKTADEAIAAGRNPNLLTDGELWPDHVIEVDAGGDIV